ncbi:FxSxx-COOH system tetratricopeptide repeat protein [Saccharothrix saharensis]|uniref:FxSxx-COOH system tetratricopeptide repeat protein n=1 Tax=Saccharothrix saharensis TaxID=571190 RepID=UPI00115452DC|nr:FxSxx-COOH system tetratricopeptide repeat protein [Saccharothrix saharensis]
MDSSDDDPRGPVEQTAVASDGANVLQAGRDLTVHVTRRRAVPAMESVSAPRSAGRIPVVPGLFVGRDRELARLAEAVAGSGRAAVVAVHGLGGVGKSTLAARFAASHAEAFGFVWWVTADSPAALDAGLAGLAAAVAPETAGLPPEERVELGTRWLATHDEWLLVLDNLTAPADAAGLLSRVRTGTVLITSRLGRGWRGVETVVLDALHPAEAVRLLTGLVRAEWPDADLADADALCAELGWLPLAVEQAAAYLAQARVTPATYLDLLARYPARMFSATAEGGDERRTAARVWRVTLDRLADTPLAGHVLRVLAWWAPEAVPRTLLAGLADEPDLVDALGRLAAHSMITLTGTTVTVHRLVQTITRTPDPHDPHRRARSIDVARDTAAAALHAAVLDLNPGLPDDWSHYHVLLPHARALLDRATHDTDTADTCALLHEFGKYLTARGDVTSAVAHLTRAVRSAERALGPDDPRTLRYRNNLAYAHWSAGDHRQAVRLHEANLADTERVLGPDHPDTLTVRNNVAYVHRGTGGLDRAIALHETNLADARRLLGPDHPNTLTIRNNLAGAHHAAGDLARAIPMYEAALADCLRVLGPHHPGTLTARVDLAGAYRAAGDVERAITLFEAVRADCERVLGPDHPDTLVALNNLATAYRSAGRLRRAIRLHEKVLADRGRVLGPDHPDTLASLNNLASTHWSAGDARRAIPLYEAAVAGCERVLGPDHPDTVSYRNNLAGARRAISHP